MKVNPESAQFNPDATELEIKLINEKLMSDYILKPSDVTRIWKTTRMKDELIAFFQELYKPASQYEEEKVEYN